MPINPYQLILARDTATGFVKVGWATDMPQGRYNYLEVILETGNCSPIYTNSPHYDQYQIACRRAFSLNEPLVLQQKADSYSKGYYSVPLNLNDGSLNISPDEFGSFQTQAMQAFYRLTENHVHAWAVIKGKEVLQIQSCRPPKHMEKLEYQVWYHSTIKRLSHYNREICAGKLIVQESGLWFCKELANDKNAST